MLFENRFIVYIENRSKILCKKGFKNVNKLTNSEVRIFLTKCSTKSYLRDIYGLEEGYEIVKVNLIIEEVDL